MKRPIPRLMKKQFCRMQLTTSELASTNGPSNWAYRTAEHLLPGKYDGSSNILAVPLKISSSPSGDPREVSGEVKTTWELSETFDKTKAYEWVTCAANELTFVDLAPSRSSMKGPKARNNKLLPKCSMWLRLVFDMPADNFNQMSNLVRPFMRSREYRQTYQSPGAVIRRARDLLENFVANPQLSDGVVGNLQAARKASAELLPPEQFLLDVKDWRTLLYREYGLAIERDKIESPMNDTSGVKAVTTSYAFPPEADPPGACRTALPRPLQYIFKNRPRPDDCMEFFFGSEYGDNPDDYVLEIKSRSRNVVYSYLAWLGLIGFFLGVVNFLRCIWPTM